VLSGESGPRETLLRLAISTEGLVLPDPAAKAPGRGAWIVPDKAALEAAMGNGHFKRSLMRAFKGGPKDAEKRPGLSYSPRLSYSDDLPQQIEVALARNLKDRLGLEMRGGNIVLGSSRIEEQARSGRLSLLLHASDSSVDGRKKLDQAWRVGREIEGSGARGTVLPLDRAALSVALGRENVVHLGVSATNDGRGATSRAADRVEQALNRLSRFLGIITLEHSSAKADETTADNELPDEEPDTISSASDDDIEIREGLTS
jgi:hypothetical protein